MDDIKEVFNQEGTPDIPEELKEALGVDEAEVEEVAPEVEEETEEVSEDEDLVVDEVETEVTE